MQGANKVGVYDLELSKFSLTNTNTKLTSDVEWLDRYHFYYHSKGQLQVSEFDGANKDSIVKAQSGYDSVQTSNGKFVYSFVETTDGLALQRSLMVIN